MDGQGAVCAARAIMCNYGGRGSIHAEIDIGGRRPSSSVYGRALQERLSGSFVASSGRREIWHEDKPTHRPMNDGKDGNSRPGSKCGVLGRRRRDGVTWRGGVDVISSILQASRDALSARLLSSHQQ